MKTIDVGKLAKESGKSEVDITKKIIEFLYLYKDECTVQLYWKGKDIR